MILTYTIMYCSVLSALVPIICAQQKRRALDNISSLIVYLVSISLLNDGIMMFMGKLGINNMPFAHVYGLVEGIILIVFFSRLIPLKNITTFILAVTYSICYVLNSMFHEKIFTFNGYARSTEALLMLTLSIFALYKFYVKEEDVFIDKSPHFWLVIGILVYFSCAFFSFLLSTEILSQVPDRFYNSWIIHNFSNIVKNVIFATGLWRLKL